MGERASYSRVYWEIVDDPKFVTIYDDDHHLAAWMRLLLIADQAHPASAHLPTNVRRPSIKALADCQLIDLLPGHRYRVHGLDAERKRRKEFATSRPPTGPGRGPNGTQTVAERGPLPPDTRGLSLDETREDETRLAEGEPSTRAEGAWDAPETTVIQWLAHHGCYVSPTGGYRQNLITAVERHGAAALISVMEDLATAGQKDGDIKGFVFGAIDFLDRQARPNLSVVAKEERADEAQSAHQRRIQNTLRLAHENGFHDAEPNARCELCKVGAA